MEKEKTVLVPIDWFERLLEISDSLKNPTDQNIIYLQGYIESAKSLIDS